MRLDREKRTIKVMVAMFCKHQHGEGILLCDDCSKLYNYAIKRIELCKFGSSKPTCAKCPIHCYNQHMRIKVKDVMRFAGPRMLLRHPYLAIQHIIDGLTREWCKHSNKS